MKYIIATSSAEHIIGNKKKFGSHIVLPLDFNKDGKKVFPDGELYFKFPDRNFDLRDKIAVIHSGAPHPNRGIAELEFILEYFKERNVKKITLVITYMPYGMQDKVFRDGEKNLAETLIKRWTENFGVQEVVVLDPHFEGREWCKKYPLRFFSALDLLRRSVLKKYPKVVFLSPDEGGERRTGIRGFKKKRHNSQFVDFILDNDVIKEIRGKDVAIVDDLIETGGTLVKLYGLCKEHGARKIVAMATHGVLSSGVDLVSNSFNDLFVTNSISGYKDAVSIQMLLKSQLI